MKEEETAAEEESPESGDNLELEEDEQYRLLYDAEVLIRAGAEKLDLLHEAGVIDDELYAKVDSLSSTLVALIEKEEE